MILKALIVDDERLARKELLSMLDPYKSIRVVGEAQDVSSARKAVETLRPDIIFLDIQMPGESGFSLLNHIAPSIRVIFVTAFDRYAIRAFEVNALDYLLKPVTPKRLKRAVEKLSSPENSKTTTLKPFNYDDRLLINGNTSIAFLKINEIKYIQAAGCYSEICTNEMRKWLSNRTMKEWEERLPENYFIRIHRSTIVNMDHIIKTEQWFGGSYRVYLKDMDEPFLLSRRYSAKMKARLS